MTDMGRGAFHSVEDSKQREFMRGVRTFCARYVTLFVDVFPVWHPDP